MLCCLCTNGPVLLDFQKNQQRPSETHLLFLSPLFIPQLYSFPGYQVIGMFNLVHFFYVEIISSWHRESSSWNVFQQWLWKLVKLSLAIFGRCLFILQQEIFLLFLYGALLRNVEESKGKRPLEKKGRSNCDPFGRSCLMTSE